MAEDIKIPGTIQMLVKNGAKQIANAEKRLNQLSDIQVQLDLPQNTRNGRSAIQFSGTKAVLSIPTDPRVTLIIQSLQQATLTGVCNGDGTITCTLTLPNFPNAYTVI